jgi:putative ABC transport system substrate-binding protein
MKRREFIALIGGAAAASPLAARAQERVKRIGVLMGWAETDPEARAALAAFLNGLQQLGWVDGRNLRIELRWAAGDPERMRKFAKELVELKPEMILANTTPVTAALHKETQTIPVVFVIVSDPVGAGFATSLAQPGGNITGFINVETAMGGKWLELLKEIAPAIKRVAIMFNPDTAPGGGSYFMGTLEAAARSLGVETIKSPVRSDAEIETVITGLGREPAGGLVVMTDGFMVVHRGAIIPVAAHNNVPAIYSEAISTRGRPVIVRCEHTRRVQSLRFVCGSRSAGGQTCRPAGTDTNQVRIGDQLAHRQGARPHCSANAPRPRRRGDRMIMVTSEIGTFETCQLALNTSAYR